MPERDHCMIKRISVLLVLFLLVSCIPTAVCAEEEIIENGSFESDAFLWSSGSFSENAPRHGLRCLAFSAPNYSAEGTMLHLNSYLSTVSLSENTVYSLKFYIRTDMTDAPQLLPEGNMKIAADTGTFTMHISHVTNTWQPVAVCFTSDTTGTFSFELAVESAYDNATIYVDEIKLSPIDFQPTGLTIQGRRSITIPEIGETAAGYVAAVTDGDGNYITNRNASVTAVDPLPEGVRFVSVRGMLYVSANASDRSYVTLLCNPSAESASFSPVSISVLLSYNQITNGDFEDVPQYSGWNTDASAFSIAKEDSGNLCAEVPVFTGNATGYSGAISPAPALLLHENEMYVFRAKVRTNEANTFTEAKARALPPGDDSVIHIEIANTGNVWTEVFAAFRVPTYGFYNLKINFFVSDAQNVYIDDVSLQAEKSAPAGIYIDAPMHISIPEEGQIEYPLAYAVFDQEGAFLQKEVSFSVSPETEGVTVSRGKLTVLPSAEPQVYTVTAVLSENIAVQSKKAIQIDTQSVGDGSFETTIPGQLWATGSPSLLHFSAAHNNNAPTDGHYFARLTMNGPVSALMSDSIYRYDAGRSYVFEADMQTIVPDIETIVTVLVDNAHSDSFDDNLVVGQFTISHSMQKMQKLFTPSETVTGRLMIAFNTPDTHSQQIVLMDDVSVSAAAVYATSVSIGGIPYVDRNIVGKYRFSSNFSAVDSSTCRWLFSNDENGIFMPIDGQTKPTLSVTSDMVGKYVKFEVTPVSLSGPVVGDSVASSPIRIGEPIPTDSSSHATPEKDPVEETQDTTPQQPTSVSRGGMQVMDIRRFTDAPKYTFFDTMQHWAKREIDQLTAAGIVQGRGYGLFEPETFITRAEFSAILARAFELAPIYYEGQFSDVKYHNWYAGAVAVVTKHGIAQGTSETTFSPELPITREEMAVMIMRAYRKTGAQTKGSNLGYTDVSTISQWALSDVGEANALGLLSGLPDGSFQPKRNATRAEATVTIKRMLTILVEDI